MKKLLSLILAGFLSAGVVEALAVSNQRISIQMETPDNSSNTHKINMHGNIAHNAGPNSVEAYYDHNMVTIFFHQNFGNVNITIMSETGSVVYNNTVNTAVQQTFYIPLSSTSSGNFTLILDNANGYAEGEFAR